VCDKEWSITVLYTALDLTHRN